jgi:hypothetical protein
MTASLNHNGLLIAWITRLQLSSRACISGLAARFKRRKSGYTVVLNSVAARYFQPETLISGFRPAMLR